MMALSVHIQKPYYGKIALVLTAVILSKIIISDAYVQYGYFV